LLNFYGIDQVPGSIVFGEKITLFTPQYQRDNQMYLKWSANWKRERIQHLVISVSPRRD
jgi:hypothetical protein